jgi:hypothetical protein
VWRAAPLSRGQTAADGNWGPEAWSLPYSCGDEPLTCCGVSEPGFTLWPVPWHSQPGRQRVPHRCGRSCRTHAQAQAHAAGLWQKRPSSKRDSFLLRSPQASPRVLAIPQNLQNMKSSGSLLQPRRRPTSSHEEPAAKAMASGTMEAVGPGRSQGEEGSTRPDYKGSAKGRHSPQHERACEVHHGTPQLRVLLPTAAWEFIAMAIQGRRQRDSLSTPIACVLWCICNIPLGRHFWRHAANVQRQRCRPGEEALSHRNTERAGFGKTEWGQRPTVTDMRTIYRKAASTTASQQGLCLS